MKNLTLQIIAYWVEDGKLAGIFFFFLNISEAAAALGQ